MSDLASQGHQPILESLGRDLQRLVQTVAVFITVERNHQVTPNFGILYAIISYKLRKDLV